MMYIVHVGSSYFPKGNAAVQRIRFTYRAIQEAGFSPLIINKESTQQGTGIKRANRFDGIPYVFTSLKLSKPSSRIVNKLNKISGLLGELKLLFKKRAKISAAILYNTSSISELIYYRIISKLFGFKLVFQYVEYRSSFEKDSLINSANDKLFDRFCSHFADGVVVISEFLKKEIIKRNCSLPIIKIPVICDFDEFDVITPASPGYNYMLYCGTSDYLEVIFFTMEMYEKIRDRNLYNGKLVLIIGVGASQNIHILEKNIQESKYSEQIILHKSVPYKEIIPMYKSADLLLIPLRKTIQDIARFPHKIGEYTASTRPLISTAVGELEYYFKNGKSAILAEEYTVDSYVAALTIALKDENIFDKMGKEGYLVGHDNFHFKSNAPLLKSFFTQLCNKTKPVSESNSQLKIKYKTS